MTTQHPQAQDVLGFKGITDAQQKIGQHLCNEPQCEIIVRLPWESFCIRHRKTDAPLRRDKPWEKPELASDEPATPTNEPPPLEDDDLPF